MGSWRHHQRVELDRQLLSLIELTTDEMLHIFWEMEHVPGEPTHLTADEQVAESHFSDTHLRDADGRYRVKLPRKTPAPVLGNSRGAAKHRLHHNQRALFRKGKLEEFQQAVQEYPDLGHAKLVPKEDLDRPPAETFYLPMHGVIKDSSQTTRLRVFFDASAKSSTGASLNDTLLKGPSLYPHLTSILN